MKRKKKPYQNFLLWSFKKYYKEYSVTRQDGQKQTFYLLL